MKKFYLLFLLFTGSLIYVNAQKPVRVGIVGGGNLSSISSDVADVAKTKLGYHAGIKTEISLTDHFFIDGSLLFTTKGYKTEYINTDGFFEEFENGLKLNGTLVNHYLELPIHAVAKIKIGDSNSFLIGGGPYAAYSLQGKATIKGGNKKLTEDIYANGQDHKRFDFGLGLKSGFEFQKHIQLFVSYNIGLIDIAKDTKDYKNRNLTVSCGYMF